MGSATLNTLEGKEVQKQHSAGSWAGGERAFREQARGHLEGDPSRLGAAPSYCPTLIPVTRSHALEALTERAVTSSLSRHPRPYSRSALSCPHPHGSRQFAAFPAFSVTSAATIHLPDQPPPACVKDLPACGRGPRCSPRPLNSYWLKWSA